MATLEGEDTVNPSTQTGPDGTLLLPVLSGESTAPSTAATTPRVALEPRSGTVRRSVR